MSKLKMNKINGPSVLIKEQSGSLGNLVTYSKTSGNKIVRLSQSNSFPSSIRQTVYEVFREVFLPHGYPDSVSQDYFNYQIWDTLQAFCSTITGTFTTQAILKGVGVGNAEASPLAAAITWILKDGTGMLGRIIFAWWKGNCLDADCKKWRLFADVINDMAMCIELTVPYFSQFSLQLLCVTSTMKAVVGVAGGATRASITQHQAIKGNMADVSAKDGSQETCVNLVASIMGITLLAVFSGGQYDWSIFLLFATMHLITNYFAVSSLMFKHLNTARLLLVIKMYMKFDTVAPPMSINKKESVLLGFGISAQSLCGYKIKMGYSLKKTLSALTSDQLMDILAIYQDKPYFIIPNFKNRTLYVAFKHNESPEDVISAYFNAIMTGIALCKFNSEPMRHLHQITPLIRMNTVMKSFPKNNMGQPSNLPKSSQEVFNEYINFELNNFFTALKVNGWNINMHAIEIGSWRYINDEQLTVSKTSHPKED